MSKSTESNNSSTSETEDESVDPAAVAKKTGRGSKPAFEPISPTGITHALRRPKSARYPTPDAGGGGRRNGFLAAEQFSAAAPFRAPPPRRAKSASPTRRRGRDSIGRFPEFVNLSGLACTSNSALPKPRGGQDTVLKHYDASSSAFTTPPRSKRSHPERPRKQVNFTGIDDMREGCINPIVETTKKVMPSGKQVGSFIEETRHKRGQMQECAYLACDFYRDSCGPAGKTRASDDEFFTDNGAANPQSPSRSLGSLGSERQDLRVTTVLSGETPTDDEFSVTFLRAKAMRYPEAATMSQLDENSILDPPTLDEATASVFTGAESILDLPPQEDDSPKSMRDYRLALFEADMQERLVPQSQLSRTLNELEIQDTTVEEMSLELEKTKLTLAETKQELRRTAKVEQKYDTALTDMKAKFITEKQALHDRLQRESEENAKLQTRLSSLSLEVSTLKSDLRSARLELKESCEALESRNADGSALVAALRSEVSHLEAELRDARMEEGRAVAKNECDQRDAVRLKAQLEQAEAELRRLKEWKLSSHADRTIQELKEALAKSEELVRMAAEKEKVMKEELNDTKAIIAALEQSNREHRIESHSEVNGLTQRLIRLETDAEKSLQRADEELNQCRDEADELRREIFRLSQELDEQTNRADFEAFERVKERNKFETIMAKNEHEGKMFREAIRKLEERLAKAERDAEERSVQPETRSVKRKLGFDRSIQPYVPAIEPDFERMEKELRQKKDAELKLKQEVMDLAGRLHAAEATASYARDQLDLLTKDGAAKNTEMERVLQNLKLELDEQRRMSEAAQNDRAHHEEELAKLRKREEKLLHTMDDLKSKLNSAETKMKDEINRAEEERRMAVETDAERIEEILRLKSRLHRTKTESSQSTKSIERKVLPAHDTGKGNQQINKGPVFNTFKDDLATKAARRQAKAALEAEELNKSNTSNGSGKSKPWYEDAPSFISSSDSSDGSIDRSQSTTQISNLTTPSSYNRSAASNAFSPFNTSSDSGKSAPFSSFSSSPGRIIANPFVASPPPIQKMRAGFSKGSALSDVQEEVQRQTSPRRSPSTRVDIGGIQRRLLASNDRLTAAKSKLRDLVQERSKNEDQEETSKHDVDDILDTITRQTQTVMDCSADSFLDYSADSYNRAESPFQTMASTFSTDGVASSSLAQARGSSSRSTEDVLERYRRYKASRGQRPSPTRRTAAINQFVSGEI